MALDQSAQEMRIPLETLKSFPQGEQRRRRHDDITAVVVFFDYVCADEKMAPPVGGRGGEGEEVAQEL